MDYVIRSTILSQCPGNTKKYVL